MNLVMMKFMFYCRDYYEERKKGNFGEMSNLFEYTVKCCFCFF